MIKPISFLLSAALLGTAFVGQSASALTSSAPLALQVSIDKTVFHKGDWPQIQAVVTNRSSSAVTLVEPGDGSSVGWRTPIVGWSILKADDVNAKHPDSIPAFHVLRCGNINSLKAREVFNLAPGQAHTLAAGSFDEAWMFDLSRRAAGMYRIVFYYQNDPTHPWTGLTLGHQDPAAISRAHASTACLLQSNELLVTFQK